MTGLVPALEPWHTLGALVPGARWQLCLTTVMATVPQVQAAVPEAAAALGIGKENVWKCRACGDPGRRPAWA